MLIIFILVDLFWKLDMTRIKKWPWKKNQWCWQKIPSMVGWVKKQIIIPRLLK